MKTVKGIYAEAKIFTDDVEDYAKAQVKMTCVKVNKSSVEFQKLNKIIRENVPAGFAIRKEPRHMARNFLMKGFTVSGTSTGIRLTGVLAPWEAAITS